MPLSLRTWSITLAALVAACSSTDGSDAEPTTEAADEPVAVSVEPIIGGTPAVAYPEAAVLDIDRGAVGAYYVCSATLIAPRVVLTAGHCVDGHTKWNVYVQNEMRAATSAITYDWAEHGATTVNPAHHDLGLVFFDIPIVLPSYPKVSATPLAAGSKVQDIGRILNGTVTSTSYEAPAILADGAKFGYPFDYASADVIQPGDSGGAVMADGTHTLVAVNSGAGSGMQVLARVDLLAAWVNAQIAAHAVQAADAGAPSPPASSSSATKPDASAPPPPVTPVCQAEKEPNNDVSTANAIGATFCGALSPATDVDWASFTVAAGTTTLELIASGDAVFSFGALSGGRCNPLGASLKTAKVSLPVGTAQACIAITSPTHKTQTYSFSAKR